MAANPDFFKSLMWFQIHLSRISDVVPDPLVKFSRSPFSIWHLISGEFRRKQALNIGLHVVKRRTCLLLRFALPVLCSILYRKLFQASETNSRDV